MKKLLTVLCGALLLVATQAQGISRHWPAGNYSDEGWQRGYYRPQCRGPAVRGTTALGIFRKISSYTRGSWQDRHGKCNTFWQLRDQAGIDHRACRNYVLDNLVIEERMETEWTLGGRNTRTEHPLGIQSEPRSADLQMGDREDSLSTADIPNDKESLPDASPAAAPVVILIARIGGAIVLRQAANWLWADIQRVQMRGKVTRMICGHSVMG